MNILRSNKNRGEKRTLLYSQATKRGKHICDYFSRGKSCIITILFLILIVTITFPVLIITITFPILIITITFPILINC